MRLKPGDEVAPLTAAGINIISDRDPNIFELPCAAHIDCTCTVYANRPRLCQAYKCELLKCFERGDISQHAALKIIEKTKSARNEVKALSLAASADDPPEEDITALMEKWLANPSVAAPPQTYPNLFFKFLILQKYLDRFFRKKSRLTARSPASAGP